MICAYWPLDVAMFTDKSSCFKERFLLVRYWKIRNPGPGVWTKSDIVISVICGFNTVSFHFNVYAFQFLYYALFSTIELIVRVVFFMICGRYGRNICSYMFEPIWGLSRCVSLNLQRDYCIAALLWSKSLHGVPVRSHSCDLFYNGLARCQTYPSSYYKLTSPPLHPGAKTLQ